MAKHTAPEEIDHWTTFTRRIFQEWDADPGYYALQYTVMPTVQRLRFAVAWCTYYNLGIAADASELKGDSFWKYLLKIYPTAVRSSERRHFRGAQGLTAMQQWRDRWGTPEMLADFMLVNCRTYFDVRKRGEEVRSFGDYFYWKWCDLHEVLNYGRLDMAGSERYSPKVPQQGAQLIHEMCGYRWPYTVTRMYGDIAEYGRLHKVPPRTTEGRGFDIQEAETVACVYKQMASGSYIYGTRTAKALKKLRAGRSDTAAACCETLLRLSPYTESEVYAALDSLKE